jgi:hypothetical protein
MATLNELTYNILNIARGGLSSDDDRLNERQIAFWIRYYRAKSIFFDSNGGRNIDQQLVQDLGCLMLEEVDKADCPEVLWGCNVKRVKIPKLVDLPDNRGLMFVGLLDKTTSFIMTPPNVMQFAAHRRFTGNMRRAYLIGQHVYVTDPFNEDIKYINIRGIWDNPQEVEYTDGDGNTSCITDDDQYPMPERYVADIVNQILRIELNMTVQSTNDEFNDSREANQPINDAAQTRN